MFLFGINAERAIGRIGRSHEAGQIQSDGQHEAQVVIGVLSDQVHTARRSKHPDTLAGSVSFAEGFQNHERERARNSITPPNTRMGIPEYRSTLRVVSEAWPGEKKPRPSRMTPRIEKNQPVGVRRSSI